VVIKRAAESLDPHIREVVTGASVALVARLGGAATRFALNVAVAWLLGARGAGLFFLATTAVTISSVLGRLGLDNTVLRFSASGADQGDWVAVTGVFRRGMGLAVAASVPITLATAFGSGWLARVVFEDPELTPTLIVISLSVVPTSVFTLYGQLLKGIKRTGQGVIVLSGLLPALSLALVLVLAPRWELMGVIAAYVLASVGTAVIGGVLWKRAVPRVRGAFPVRVLLRSSMPLFVNSSLQLVVKHSSLIVLGIFAATADVGIFGAAYRTAFLISYALVAVNSITSPKFSALYQRGDTAALRRTAQGSTFLICAVAGPVLALFVLAPNHIMRIYSEEFVQGGTLLAILATGQFVNVATGSVQGLLMMCGHEAWMMRTTAVSAGLILILNSVLIPRWGGLGAAIATSSAWIVQNLLVLAAVRMKLGFWVWPSPKAWRRG
jgi:O-antigen/teichoic acid export membrane protein